MFSLSLYRLVFFSLLVSISLCTCSLRTFTSHFSTLPPPGAPFCAARNVFFFVFSCALCRFVVFFLTFFCYCTRSIFLNLFHHAHTHTLLVGFFCFAFRFLISSAFLFSFLLLLKHGYHRIRCDGGAERGWALGLVISCVAKHTYSSITIIIISAVIAVWPYRPSFFFFFAFAKPPHVHTHTHAKRSHRKDTSSRFSHQNGNVHKKTHIRRERRCRAPTAKILKKIILKLHVQ